MSTDTAYSEMKSVLKNRGWIKGALQTKAGVCLIGASTYSCQLPQTIDKIVEHLGLIDPDAGCLHPLAVWNDAPERTIEEVYSVLDELHEKELAERGEL
jgi:hypothetical protein